MNNNVTFEFDLDEYKIIDKHGFYEVHQGLGYVSPFYSLKSARKYIKEQTALKLKEPTVVEKYDINGNLIYERNRRNEVDR